MDRNEICNRIIDASKNIESMGKLETEVLEENSSNKTDNEASKSAFNEVLTAFVAEKILEKTDEKLKNDEFRKAGVILLIGLAHSGKSTLLHTMAQTNGCPVINVGGYEEVTVNNVKISTNRQLNVGQTSTVTTSDSANSGSATVTASAVILLVDSTDWSLMDVAKNQFNDVLMNPTLANKPVMLVFTKRDLINTESEKFIDSYFEIPDDNLYYKPNHNREGKVLVFKCNLHNQRTFSCVFRYISKYLKDV